VTADDVPGQAVLSYEGKDAAENTTRAKVPLVVEGGEPLSVRLIDLPATAGVQERVVPGAPGV
jgi:hypothetical protein